MRRFLIFLFSLFAFTLHGQDDTVQRWTRKADFPASSRNFGLGFAINGKGYYGMGHKQTKPFIYKTYNDLWEYDPTLDTWTQKADFPGPGRLMAQGFSIDNKIYIGFGYLIAAYGPNAGSNDYLTDLYQFDPGANTWVQKNQALLGRGDFFFVLNNTAYAVNPELRALNTYNQQADTWIERKWDKEILAPESSNLYGTRISFSLTGSEHFITTTCKKKCMNSLWAFDPDSLTWKQKAVINGKGNDSIQVFIANEKTYLLRGSRGFMQYSPKDDVWFTMEAISAEHAYFKPAFSISKKCYGFNRYEFWEFTPQ